MALTPSTMRELGFKAPNFSLADVVTGKTVFLSDLDTTKGLLVAFICNHCPYVKHIAQPLARVLNQATDQGLAVVCISSNDVEAYPDDSPEKMKEFSKKFGFKFSYLFDESQKVARDYEAACTPDFFLFDAKLECVYRGQFDDSRPGNGVEPSGHDLKQAIERVLAGKKPEAIQSPSIGCNIKWKEKK